MTAVNWLIEELKKVHHPTEAMIMYAKKLEKQQIIDAWKMGRYENDKIVMSERFYSEQYYNETYGSKGSDATSSQTEISDEEIEEASENAWSDYEYEEGNLYSTTFKGGWKLAIKWYREQLKQNL